MGTYAITSGAGTLSAPNYQLIFVNGALMVDPATLTVTADSQSRTYGSTNPTLTAEEAADLGLITEVVDDERLAERADELAGQLVALPAQALSSTKRLVWSGLGAPVEARLAEEARTVSDLSGTADALEGLRAVIERRAPRFTGK